MQAANRPAWPAQGWLTTDHRHPRCLVSHDGSKQVCFCGISCHSWSCRPSRCKEQWSCVRVQRGWGQCQLGPQRPIPSKPFVLAERKWRASELLNDTQCPKDPSPGQKLSFLKGFFFQSLADQHLKRWRLARNDTTCQWSGQAPVLFTGVWSYTTRPALRECLGILVPSDNYRQLTRALALGSPGVQVHSLPETAGSVCPLLLGPHY